MELSVHATILQFIFRYFVSLLATVLATVLVCFAPTRAQAARSFVLDGQLGWNHDDGIPGGFFHTFDALKVGGENDTPRKVHVFLPKDYESAVDRYPVVYFNDGQSAFFNGGANNRSLNVPRIVSDLYTSQRLRKIIVVAVTPLNRSFEYSHAPALGQTCCGIVEYANYLADRVKPFIDRNYRTLPQRMNSLVAGSSRGGLAAFLVSVLRPLSFGNALVQSGSFWVGLDEPGAEPYSKNVINSDLIARSKETLLNPLLRPDVYLDWGLNHQNGFANTFIEARASVRGRELSDLLRSDFGYTDAVSSKVFESGNLKEVVDPLGTHDEDAWSKRLGDALTFFFGTSP
jgi:Putative esterase